MVQKQKKYTWYVEPEDAHTNQIIGEEMGEKCKENSARHLKCADGQEHNLWRCPNFPFLNKFLKNRGQLKLKFRIFNQRGNGQIRAVNFLKVG